jgi:hypothetical protein
MKSTIDLKVKKNDTLKNILSVIFKEDITHLKINKDSISFATKDNLRDINHSVMLRLLKNYLLIEKNLSVLSKNELTCGVAFIDNENSKKYFASMNSNGLILSGEKIFSKGKFNPYNESFAVYELLIDIMSD